MLSFSLFWANHGELRGLWEMKIIEKLWGQAEKQLKVKNRQLYLFLSLDMLKRRKIHLLTLSLEMIKQQIDDHSSKVSVDPGKIDLYPYQSAKALQRVDWLLTCTFYLTYLGMVFWRLCTLENKLDMREDECFVMLYYSLNGRMILHQLLVMAPALVWISTSYQFRHLPKDFLAFSLLFLGHDINVILQEADVLPLLPSRPFSLPSLFLSQGLQVNPMTHYGDRIVISQLLLFLSQTIHVGFGLLIDIL